VEEMMQKIDIILIAETSYPVGQSAKKDKGAQRGYKSQERLTVRYVSFKAKHRRMRAKPLHMSAMQMQYGPVGLPGGGLLEEVRSAKGTSSRVGSGGTYLSTRKRKTSGSLGVIQQ